MFLQENNCLTYLRQLALITKFSCDKNAHIDEKDKNYKALQFCRKMYTFTGDAIC